MWYTQQKYADKYQRGHPLAHVDIMIDKFRFFLTIKGVDFTISRTYEYFIKQTISKC